MGEFHLVQVDLDQRTLGRQTHRLSVPGADDPGYPVHAALEAVFGTKALRPFVVAPRGAPPGVLPILAYAQHSGDALRDHAQRFAEAAWYQTVRWDSFAAKPMPRSWQAGDRLGFEVRVCPIVRSRGPEGNTREVDVFLAEAHRVPKETRLDRGDVYTSWLRARLEQSGVQPDRVEMKSFRRVKLVRRTQGDTRKARRLERPEVWLRGELTVEDGSRFEQLLARGVGRHRAFGFGMLLLRAPTR